MYLNEKTLEKRTDKTAEIVIGNTTYLVLSFFKETAKGNVIDKISRLIERDADFIMENENITNIIGMSD